MHLNLKPAFRYQLGDYLKASGAFVLVMVVIFAASAFGSIYLSGNLVSCSGFGMAAAICLFVFGIVTPRPNLRLCVQFGVSRRTAFLSMLLAILADVVILSAVGEMLVWVGQIIGMDVHNLFYADLYQLIYLGTQPMLLSIGQHVMSFLLNSALILFLFINGMFFTFLFWRLNKVWTVIVAIAIPVLCNLIPICIYRLGSLYAAIRMFFQALQHFILNSVWNFISMFLLLSLIFAVIDWLLIRRANIKEPTSK